MNTQADVSASDEDNPPEVRGAFSVSPIASGVAVSNTQLTYTFLCSECLNSSLGLGPEATIGNAVMGWALSERAPEGDASDPGARLGFHERGFGPFTARLANARTQAFDSVAATAGTPVADSGRAVEAQLNIFDGDGDSDSDDDGDDFGGAAVGGGGVAAGAGAVGAGAVGTAVGTGRTGAGRGNTGSGGAVAGGDDSDSDSDSDDD
jgi:hypothetical protein